MAATAQVNTTFLVIFFTITLDLGDDFGDICNRDNCDE